MVILSTLLCCRISYLIILIFRESRKVIFNSWMMWNSFCFCAFNGCCLLSWKQLKQTEIGWTRLLGWKVALTLPSLSCRTLFKRNHHTILVHIPLGVTNNIKNSFIPTNPLTFSLLLLIDFHQAKWQWQEWKMSSKTAKLWELLHSLLKNHHGLLSCVLPPLDHAHHCILQSWDTFRWWEISLLCF